MYMIHIFKVIKTAIDNAPPKTYVAELHLQIIKHADALSALTAREFCKGVGIPASYAPEFSKMIKISPRLKAAGLTEERI